MGEEINKRYDMIVYLEVPAEIRGIRLRQRAAEKFGERVLPGGDLYEQEEKFFAFAAGRSSAPIEEWIKNMPCRVIRLDGREPVRRNIEKSGGFFPADEDPMIWSFRLSENSAADTASMFLPAEKSITSLSVGS